MHLLQDRCAVVWYAVLPYLPLLCCASVVVHFSRCNNKLVCRSANKSSFFVQIVFFYLNVFLDSRGRNPYRAHDQGRTTRPEIGLGYTPLQATARALVAYYFNRSPSSPGAWAKKVPSEWITETTAVAVLHTNTSQVLSLAKVLFVMYPGKVLIYFVFLRVSALNLAALCFAPRVSTAGRPDGSDNLFLRRPASTSATGRERVVTTTREKSSRRNPGRTQSERRRAWALGTCPSSARATGCAPGGSRNSNDSEHTTFLVRSLFFCVESELCFSAISQGRHDARVKYSPGCL